MTDMTYKTVAELTGAMESGETTSRKLVEAAYARIEKLEPEVNGFISTDKEAALKAADEADKRRAAGETGSLLGVPIVLKDLIAVEDGLTTCGSKMLDGYRSPYSATVAKRLQDAGAVNLGKANMDEFAMGSSNETSYFGACKNPWDLNAVPGGSSGGSAAVVAAGYCPVSLGSDTGGSIRQPASHCGVVGLKPTYGRVSRFGLVAFASSLDQIGPMAHTVEDTAIMLQAIAGHDPMESREEAKATRCWCGKPWQSKHG